MRCAFLFLVKNFSIALNFYEKTEVGIIFVCSVRLLLEMYQISEKHSDLKQMS